MKTLRLLILVAVAALAVPLRAAIGQVTTLDATTPKIIVIPGTYAKLIIIQNNGSNSVRISVDGGTTYTDQQTGKAGSNPTTTTGYLLPAGQQLVLSTTPSSSGLHRPIVAIMVTSTTTLDIVTDDSPGSNASSTFPTS